MLEKVYSNENGDIGQANRLPPSFKMPKNVRQIGNNSSDKKIYVEDYVMTFIRQLAGDNYSSSKTAVLVGQYVRIENASMIFISGALELEGFDLSTGDTFTNEVWTSIYENIKKYFVECEIVGWYLAGPSYLLEDHEKIRKTHLDNFAGQDKTLMTYDSMEREEAFWFYKDNKLAKQEGYYIYYDKNEDMQTYMIEHNNKGSQEAEYDDRVAKEIRAVLDNKKPEKKEKRKSVESKGAPRLIYAAGTLLAVILLIAAAAMLDNYDQMKTMQDTLDSLAKNYQLNYKESGGINNPLEAAVLENAQAREDTGEISDPVESGEGEDVGGESLDVEILPGDVSPIEEDPVSPSEKPDKKVTDKPTNKPDESPSENEKKYYTVSAGDTLAGISYKLYDSPNYITEIMRLNNIDDENYIYIGQKLIVP